MQYNEAQETAIRHVDGPMMTLAGPGSGKTTVLAERVRYLIDSVGVDPVNILVITFTKAAALEMQSRFYAKYNGEKPPCTFGTFHSVFFMILRAAYHYTGENVLSEDMKYRILREIIGRMHIEYEDVEDFLSGIIGEISELKAEMIEPAHYYSKNCGEDVFRSIYQAYMNRLLSMRKLDFDDMMVYCYELFRERPDILANWQKRYRYILIDEFQDINPIQYEIVKLLAAPSNNLFIVGDDDQSMYRFRGARPEIMLGFPKDFPETKQVLLNINYRCSRDICESAARVIAHNQKRFEKQIISQTGYDHPVRVHRMRNQRDEYLHIIKQMKQYKDQGIPYEQMAVLYRTNIQPRGFVSQLLSYNVPFQMKDNMPGLYQHFTVQNVLTYIRIAMGDKSRASYLSIINKPKRYISREAFMDEQVNIDALMEFYKDKKWAVDYLIQFKNDLDVLTKMTPYAAVTYIRKAIGYDRYLKEYADARKMQPDEFYQILDELLEQVKEYKTFDEMFAGIQVYEEEMTRKRQESKQERQGATLSTLHSAKGLEYDVVFILDANEGYIPHRKSVQIEELEEERRMFYVGMTRAKTFLHIYSVAEIYGKPVEPSRFLGELLEG